MDWSPIRRIDVDEIRSQKNSTHWPVQGQADPREVDWLGLASHFVASMYAWIYVLACFLNRCGGLA
jgi:hypothetical protein